MAGSKSNRGRQEGQADNCTAEAYLGDVPTATPRERRRRRQIKPLDDPDVEAFCRIYAGVVLRIKGLEGLPKVEQAQEEVNRESA